MEAIERVWSMEAAAAIVEVVEVAATIHLPEP
jgi:hypothetical protein